MLYIEEWFKNTDGRMQYKTIGKSDDWKVADRIMRDADTTNEVSITNSDGETIARKRRAI